MLDVPHVTFLQRRAEVIGCNAANSPAELDAVLVEPAGVPDYQSLQEAYRCLQQENKRTVWESTLALLDRVGHIWNGKTEPGYELLEKISAWSAT
jgi:hypothetical protein